MQAFMKIIRDAKRLREDVEKMLGEALKQFLIASAWMREADLRNALSSPEAKLSLTVKTKNVMSVRIPEFTLTKEGNVKTYGLAGTNTFLDEAIEAFDHAFETLIQLAQIEKQAEAMAIELETTRRRVNALEYKMIPDLKDTVKYIRLKLDETERAVIIGTMKVKAQIEAQAAAA